MTGKRPRRPARELTDAEAIREVFPPEVVAALEAEAATNEPETLANPIEPPTD